MCIRPNGTIILHDTLPWTEEVTGDTYKSGGWTGNSWMCMHRLINYYNKSRLSEFIEIYSWTPDILSVIKVKKELPEEIIKGLKFILIDEPIELTYKDYNLVKMHPEHDISKFIHDKVSYFTPLYNTKLEYLNLVYSCLVGQTNPNWEWVCFDDSPQYELYNTFVELCKDPRVKYRKMNINSSGVIGESKYRAAMFCTGKYVAELDHDDILLPEMTQKILSTGEKYNADFIYTDSAEIYFDTNTNEISDVGRRYGDNFGMGYCSYYDATLINPLTNEEVTVSAIKCAPLNPKSLRHIVGVPNHIRCWKREFYMNNLQHCRTLPVADDYEMVVKTVVNNGICVHIPWCGYLQLIHNNNTTDLHRPFIQVCVASVRASYEQKLIKYFNEADPIYKDWAADQLHTHFNGDMNLYHCIRNFEAIWPKCKGPRQYPKLLVATDI